MKGDEMLCAYYAQGSWRTLSAHELPDPRRMVLVERRGACPGDGGEIAGMIAGTAEPGAVAERARAWLQHGWAATSVERPAPAPPAGTDRGRGTRRSGRPSGR